MNISDFYWSKKDKICFYTCKKGKKANMEAIESLDKECSALGGLFQQVVNDMKVRQIINYVFLCFFVVGECPLMTSDDFRRFLTYLPTLFNPKTSDFLGHFEPPYLP